MRKLLIMTCIAACGYTATAQRVQMPQAKFSKGNEAAWRDPGFNDASWQSLKTSSFWEKQGIDYNGYAWYRIHVNIPSSLKTKSALKDTLLLNLAYIDDCDEVFFNGKKVGQTGRFPEEQGGYSTAYSKERAYRLALKDLTINWDKENVIAVKVYDGDGDGGIGNGTPYITILDYIDNIVINTNNNFTFADGNVKKVVKVINKNKEAVKGLFTVSAKDEETGKIIFSKEYGIGFLDKSESPKEYVDMPVEIAGKPGITLTYKFTEQKTGKSIIATEQPPYILTPKAPETPRINGAQVTGVRPNSPLIYKVAATGKKPLTYSAVQLPEGLKLDAATGIITGAVAKAGDYPVKISVKNTLGTTSRTLTIKVGDLLALTPAMGWNSWNCWGLSVTADKVKSSAQALIDKGLIDHGWTYINVDDAWEAPARAADGTIVTNEKFPDMKALGDWLHSHGLKFGIYSSPGRLTCGGYLGSLGHELQDAETYNKWGVDYLKHDWCSYSEVAGSDTSLETFMKPYRVMQKALRAQPRDIYYSLCQYGMKDVWKWGPQVDANSWRTTGDITDTWESLHEIGFRQYKISEYAKPGRWNDPDMLIVGKVGWSGSLRNTRLTPDEQYTHISLWSLLASPLLIGCDIVQMDDFTLNLLTNDEVIAVNQDVLGKQARRVLAKDNYEVYVKELADGSKAVGFFNLSDKYRSISVNPSDIGLSPAAQVRDVWRQKDLGKAASGFSYKLAPHGVMMIKVKS
ncbi:putative Ig domain-containing protein [Mucilaginibacter sp. UR6-1]|uniref:putative Ig domain-containing protein n=1 Tax=Mucilaginibacter sp. UR6-1 TaxID=1435643 RepID=UPI001E60277B|nr:putative Ig domain-containing protein [Mucilaginibacter sp. UR6-1]MCC8411071.1 putative Ig domain-containing protein [Mucilaginibacter sp. UR6-1]